MNMKRLFHFFATLGIILCLGSSAIGQTTIFSESGGGSAPTGWTFENNVTSTSIDRGSYWMVQPGNPGDFITTTSYDLSAYANAEFDVNIRSYGSGTHRSLKIEVSYDGGTTYTQTETTPITTGSYLTRSISLNSVSSQVKLRFSVDATSGRGIRLQNLVLTASGTSGPVPTITEDLTGFNGSFGSVAVNDSSASSSFSVSGSDLEGDVTVTAPASFEVSADNSTFSSSIVLAENGGSLVGQPVTVYARFTPSTTGSLNGDIALTSTNATQVDISVDGTGVSPFSGNSDIVEASGFVYPTNIDYASFQSSSITNTGDAVEIARFTLRDGGSSTDADAAATLLESLSFSVNNHGFLRKVALYDGSTEIDEVNASSTINFTGLSLTAADDGTKEFSIYATFSANVTDNEQFQLTITEATADDLSGSYFSAVDAGGASTSVTGDNNKIEVTATDLFFTVDPTDVAPNDVMTPSPEITAIDGEANTDLDFVGSVSLTTTGTFAGSATTSVTAVDGVATFNNLAFSAGTGLTIEGSATGVASTGNSTSFDVALNYCDSYGNTSYGTSVTEISLSDLTNNSGAKTNAYEDFTNLTATVQTGGSYDLSVNLETDGSYTIHSLVWIDWNQDGDFDDSNEEYDLGDANNVSNGPTSLSPLSITVPATAAVGNTRMRVTARYNSDPASCQTSFDGEVEDYTVIVQSPSGSLTSDIVSAAGFTPTSNIDYTQYTVSSALTTSNAIKIGEFELQDGGGSNDSDTLSTVLTEISFDISNHDNIAALALFEGTNNISEQTSVTATTTFSGLNLTATDDNSKTFAVYASFESTVTDNEQLELVVTAASADINGSLFSAIDAGGATTSTTGDHNRIAVVASELVFEQNTTNTIIANAMTPAPTVVAYDGLANIDVDFTGTVELTASGANFDATAVNSVNSVNGIATFNNLVFSAVTVGATLEATSTGLTSTTSNAFDVTSAPILPTVGTVFITEIVDADNDFNAEFLELFNNSGDNIDLSTSKLIRMTSGGSAEYTFDFGTDESTANVDAVIPPNGFLIVARGATRSEFETEYGSLDASVAYNGGHPDLYFGSGRRWQLLVGGTPNASFDGTLIDDTESAVGSNRDIQNIFTGDYSVEGNHQDANPGELDYFVYNNGSWVNSSAPSNSTNTKEAIVYDDLTVSSNLALNNLYVDNSVEITVDGSSSLTVESSITNNGTIIVENDGALLQSGSEVNNGSGSYQVKRNSSPLVDETRFNFWSSPLQSTTLGSAFPNSNPVDFYAYNNSSWGSSLAAATTMTPGFGYTATGDPNADYTNPVIANINFTGNQVNNGDVTVSGLNGDYILLGNPYPSGLSANDLITNTDINAVYFWDHQNATNYSSQNGNQDSDYAVFNGSGGTKSDSGNVVPSGNIGTGQGFMAQFSTTQSGGSLTFSNDWRTATNDQFFSPIIDESKVRTWLNLTNENGAFNQILVALFDNTTDELDVKYDAPRVKANPSLSFYSKLNAADYAIQALAKPTPMQGKVVELGVDAWETGEYTIELDSLTNWPTDYTLELVDVQEGAKINLLETESYAFEVTQTGSIAQRFYLNINKKLDQNNTDNNGGLATSTEEVELKNIKVYQALDQLWIDALQTNVSIEQIDVITVNGQVVATERVNNNNARHNIATSGLAQGIYLVKVTATNGSTINQKVFIK